jgi:oligoribonuclease NrnB/cAMP/cGMP phosphodiesterase (DHH superfamily)
VNLFNCPDCGGDHWGSQKCPFLETGEKTMMPPDLCIYHGACDDGFGAAFALWKRYGDKIITYHPGVYGEAPPDVSGLDVAIVDFSYKRPVMIDLAAKAKSILVLDHHKTAEAELAGLADECPNVNVVFDMERSGAVMAWNYFHPRRATPEFFLYLQDRDLWRKQMPGVDEFTAALRSYAQDFQLWDKFYDSPQSLITEGHAIQRYYRTLILGAKSHAYMREIGGHYVPVVNASLFMASELAGELAEGHAFAAVYAESKTHITWSLRSRAPDGADVSEIAKQFGGGGHKHAAGFREARSADS